MHQTWYENLLFRSRQVPPRQRDERSKPKKGRLVSTPSIRESLATTWGTDMRRTKQPLSAARMTEIFLLVDRIHQQMNFRVPPFRFEDFLKSFTSYRVFETDLPAKSDGQLILPPDRDHKLIYLRRDNSRTRVRFSLAHAVIHAELHCGDRNTEHSLSCRTTEHGHDRRRSITEREADFGAAALLMPLWMLDRYVPYRSSTSYPGEVIRRLARMFRVSETAMQAQLDNYCAGADKQPAAAATGHADSHSNWLRAASGDSPGPPEARTRH